MLIKEIHIELYDIHFEKVLMYLYSYTLGFCKDIFKNLCSLIMQTRIQNIDYYNIHFLM